MNVLSVLLAAAAPFTARLGDPLEWLYPDSPATAESVFAETDVPANGVADANVFLTGLEPGVPVAFSCDVAGGEWYRLVDVPVEENTAPGAGVEHQGGGWYYNAFVCRRAPFRVFEALEPVAGSVTPTGSVLALRWRLDRLPCAKGAFTANLRVAQGAETRTLPLKATVHDMRLPEVGADSFKYTNWIDFRNVATRHGLEMWSDAHYGMIEKYMRLAVKGRQNVSWITVRSVFSLEDGKIVFHEDRFNRLLDIYARVGIRYVEGGHVAGHTDHRNDSPTFSTVLGRKVTTTPEGEREIAEIVGRFRAAAEKRGLADRWYQHVADEPMRENCKAFLDTCKIVRRHLPKAKLLDAICDDWAMDGLDIVTPQNHVWEQNRGTYDAFAARHPKGVWCYTCLAPGGRWMNRLMDMELLRPVYIPWCCVLNGIDGYLHWGYNMYGEKQDPFTNSCLANFDFDGGCTLPAGDTHIVYPGKDGPWPSVRFEAVRAGLEDADLLTMLKARDAAKADALIRRLVRGFGDYTADPRLYRTVRRALLEELAGTAPRPDATVSVVRLGDASLVRLEEDRIGNADPKAIVLETGAAERDGAPIEGTVLERALRIRDTLATLVLRFPRAKVIWKPVFAHGFKPGDPRLERERQTYHAVATYVKRLKDERLFVCWSGDLKPYLDFAEGRSEKRPGETPLCAPGAPRRTASYSETPAVAPHWMIDCSAKVGVPYEARFAKKLFEKDVCRGRDVDVVALGDSITHRFEKGVGMDSWKTLAREFSMLNFGFGGDETQHLLWNLRFAGFLDGYEAKVVTLMIGTNNWEGEDEVVAGIRKCLDEIRRRQPRARIVLYAILPRLGPKDDALRAKNERVNARIRAFADGTDVTWVDLRPLFTGLTPERRKELLPDGCHPSSEAYRMWREEVTPVFRRLIAARDADIPREERVKLVEFSTAEACRGVAIQKWGGEKKAEGRFDAERNSLRMTFTKTDCTLTSAVLNDALAELIRTRGPAQRCYVRYRGNSIDGRTDIHFDTPEIYALPLGMRRDGRVGEIVVPIGGDNVKGIPFEPKKLKQIGIVGLGTGDIDIFEIGVVYRIPPKKLLDATPVDTDEVALFPEPETFRLEGEALPLVRFAPPKASGFGTDHAAEWFAKEMRTFYGACFDPSGAKISFGIGEDDRIRHDGFAIRVRADGITVVGREPMGVMNGARTLASLVKQFSGDVGPARVRPLEIVDSPRLKDRMLHIMMSCWDHANRYEPDGFADMLEKFAIDARFNLFSFELATHYRYEAAPGTGTRRQSWDRKDLTRLVDRLNAAGAKAVPYVQSPGHQDTGIFAYKDVRPDLRDDGHEQILCIRNPGTYPFLFGMCGEIADICSHNPGYKADVFYAGADEVAWKPGLTYEQRCKLCRDSTYADLYAEHLGKMNDWCRAHGYSMMICTDMLNDTHNGQNRWKLGDARDKVPTDATMLHWSTMDTASAPFWTSRGNANWKVTTGYFDDPAGDAYMTGWGIALYNYNFWLSRTRSGHQGNYGLMAMRLTAALGWGASSAYEGEWKEKTARWGNFLMRNWSRKPIPHGTDRFGTVDLAGAATRRLEGKFDYAVRELAHVPTAVAKDAAGLPVGVGMGEKPVEVKVGRRAASLVFLHAAHCPKEVRTKFYNKFENYFDWPEGAPTGVWTVKYADGTTAAFDVRYGWNVGESEPGSGHQKVFERFVTDARYAWSDADGATVWQHEWVNPHPEKEIVSLTLDRKSKYLEYVLLALTAREAAPL